MREILKKKKTLTKRLGLYLNLVESNCELFIKPDLSVCVSVHHRIHFSSSTGPNPVISLIITSIIALI